MDVLIGLVLGSGDQLPILALKMVGGRFGGAPLSFTKQVGHCAPWGIQWPTLLSTITPRGL